MLFQRKLVRKKGHGFTKAASKTQILYCLPPQRWDINIARLRVRVTYMFTDVFIRQCDKKKFYNASEALNSSMTGPQGSSVTGVGNKDNGLSGLALFLKRLVNPVDWALTDQSQNVLQGQSYHFPPGLAPMTLQRRITNKCCCCTNLDCEGPRYNVLFAVAPNLLFVFVWYERL